MSPTLLWFRQDLRLHDHHALHAAIARGAPIVPVYILDDAAEGSWRLGGAARWWLHHSLAALDGALRERGAQLILRRGDSGTVLRDLVREAGATAVYWSRRYEPELAERDARTAAALRSSGIDAQAFEGALLFEPAAVRNRQGGPFQVFTPFWRHCLSLPVPPVVTLAPGPFPAPARWPVSLPLERLGLQPTRAWADGFGAAWQPGEAAARARLQRFVRKDIAAYADRRDFPGMSGTSRLSPHLRFGELSPRQVWAAVRHLSRDSGVFPLHPGAAVYLSEIGWREFAAHLLVAFPATPTQPLRTAFREFRWADDPQEVRWRAWTRGRTGYPIVDAGLRELWRTGWMHNRVRMIVASFLVKHLRLPWQRGAEWFWDTLVDADLASNTLNWQWSAGCGADAAPYFRIFAPVAQGGKFDPEGDYVRRWVPELAGLPARHLHAPWLAPESVLAAAGVRLGDTYPHPVVDHGRARIEALAAFRELRQPGPP